MQCKATAYEPVVREWLKEWNPVPFKVIVKPVESAGSDDVKLCLSEEEVRSKVVVRGGRHQERKARVGARSEATVPHEQRTNDFATS